MVYFDLEDPETPLPDKEMWPQVMKLLPQPPVLDTGLPKPRAEVLCAGKCFTRITSYNVCYTKLLRASRRRS